MLSARLGGEITVESVENEGSTFTFYIETKAVQPSSGEVPQTKFVSSSQNQMRSSINGLFTDNLAKKKTKTSTEGSSQESSTRRIKDAKITKPNTSNKPKYNLLVVEDNIINQKIMYVVEILSYNSIAHDFG